MRSHMCHLTTSYSLNATIAHDEKGIEWYGRPQVVKQCKSASRPIYRFDRLILFAAKNITKFTYKQTTPDRVDWIKRQ